MSLLGYFLQRSVLLEETNITQAPGQGKSRFIENNHRAGASLVLSLQGEMLQVYTNSVEGQFFGDNLCYFDGKLLAPVFRRGRHSDTIEEVLALCDV